LVGPVAFACLLFLTGVVFYLTSRGHEKTVLKGQDVLADLPADKSPKTSRSTRTRPPLPQEVGEASSRQNAPPGAKKTTFPKTPPNKQTAPPAPPAVKAPVALREDELKKQLLQVPEIDFYPVVDKLHKDIQMEGAGKLLRFTRQRPPADTVRRSIAEAGRVKFNQNVNVLVLEQAQRKGLPVRTESSCKVNLATAKVMQALSSAIRTMRLVSFPGLPMDPAASAKFREWLKTHPLEDKPGTRRILVQMLQVENQEERLILVEELARADDNAATVALARRALFDPSRAVREASIRILKKRSAEVYRAVLRDGLRYPWAPVADHAAEALVRLQDRGAVRQLEQLLDQPDPSLPVFDAGKQNHVVRELVRINHMRNCYLCHGAAPVLEAPIGGRVPPVGKPLGKLYYEEMAGEFVRADITFLRQDFSLFQTVPDPAPWPARQRYDFLVRERPATAQEIARLKKPPASYPQREAVLSALHRLTGKDYALSGNAKKPAVQPVPVDKKVKPAPAAQRTLLAALTALGIGPRAKPHVKATSPDGKSLAVVAGNEVVVSAGGAPERSFRLAGHQAKVTSVWWTLDGKTIVTDDLQGMVIKYNATSGKQILAFFKP
jgi:hypothetical protein